MAKRVNMNSGNLFGDEQPGAIAKLTGAAPARHPEPPALPTQEPVTSYEREEPIVVSQPVATAPDMQRYPPAPRERGEVPFDEFYTKKTMHFIPLLLEHFDALAKKQHKSKTRLVNEAIAAILAQYGALDAKTRRALEEFGITVPEE